jgi:hypothetical protein
MDRRHLSEGFYPIDCSDEALNKIAVDPPKIVDVVADPEQVDIAKAWAVVAIVAPNSD